MEVNLWCRDRDFGLCVWVESVAYPNCVQISWPFDEDVSGLLITGFNGIKASLESYT